jgi:hypothetical protein
MRILIFTPANPVKPYVHELTVRSVMNIEWDKPFEYTVGIDDTGTRPSRSMSNMEDRTRAYTNLLNKYQKARDIVLNGYDALLTLEADVVVTPNILKVLTKPDYGVVSALYCSRLKPHNWLVNSEFGNHRAPFLSIDPKWRKKVWGKTIVSSGHGLGCTLIHRCVLQEVEFRCPDAFSANDWYFATDCQELGIEQAHVCLPLAGHIVNDKILWPCPKNTYREEKLWK